MKPQVQLVRAALFNVTPADLARIQDTGIPIEECVKDQDPLEFKVRVAFTFYNLEGIEAAQRLLELLKEGIETKA